MRFLGNFTLLAELQNSRFGSPSVFERKILWQYKEYLHGIDFDCQNLSAIPTIDKCKMSKAFWTVCF